jgi:hypothetical protein
MEVKGIYLKKVKTTKGSLDIERVVDKIVCIYEISVSEDDFIQNIEKEYEVRIIDRELLIDIYFDLIEQDCVITNVW